MEEKLIFIEFCSKDFVFLILGIILFILEVGKLKFRKVICLIIEELVNGRVWISVYICFI